MRPLKALLGGVMASPMGGKSLHRDRREVICPQNPEPSFWNGHAGDLAWDVLVEGEGLTLQDFHSRRGIGPFCRAVSSTFQGDKNKRESREPNLDF